MKVSIIIPVYNVEAYIIECLESVARQTYRGEMECLIVDDCGTDNSISMAEQFIQSYKGDIHFRILHHKHNRGLSAARNTGVEEALGDFIYFLDSDDAIIPETIEEMVGVVQKYPQIEMVQGGIVSMNGPVVADFTAMKLPTYTDDVEWISKNMFFYLPVSSWNRLLKKDFLLKENIIFHEGIIHEDVPYNYMLAMKCRYIGFVPSNTYIYRQQRSNSILNSLTEKHSIQSRLIIMDDCIDAYLSHQFETKDLQSVALKALWKKWMYYMKIHSQEVLSHYKSDISKISKRMLDLTPYPQKIIAKFYHSLPIRLRGNERTQKLFLSLQHC